MATVERTITGARWSSAVRCARRAVYDHQDAPKSEPSEQQRRWWRRGKAVEAAIRGEIFAELRADGRRPRAEEEIPWPATDPVGVGHADAWIPSERMIIEIKSNGEAGLTREAALQTAGYAINKRADQAVVISVDSNTFEERHYPISLDGLADEVHEIENRVAHGCRTGSLPERACRHPNDTPAFFCPYVEHCFQDWQRPEPDVLLLDEEARVLAELEDDVRQARDAVKAAERSRDEQRAALRPYLDPGQEVETASVRVRVSAIEPRRSLSLADMTKAGVAVPEHLEPFVKAGEPSERWTVRRIDT